MTKQDNQLYIHIGMNKTGSSSIQESLQSNLKSNQWEYINLGSSNHSGAMLVAFMNNFLSSEYNHTIESMEELNLTKENILSRLTEQIKYSTKQKYIISGEMMILLNKDELVQMKSFFQQYFKTIKIVAYVRTPKEYNESAMQQIIKFHDYKNCMTIMPEYRNFFEDFDMVFGRENVYLWKFEPKYFPQGDVVLDFCNKLNIDLELKYTVRVNESLSKEAISLLYVYRKYLPQKEKGEQRIKENEAFINLLSNVGSSKYKVSSKFIRPLLLKHESDIKWMENRLGESLSGSIEFNFNDVNDEEDLEKFAIESVHLIIDKIDKKYFNNPIDKKTPQGIANIVHALRLTVGKNDNSSLNKEQNDIERKTFLFKTNIFQSKTNKILSFLKSKTKRWTF